MSAYAEAICIKLTTAFVQINLLIVLKSQSTSFSVNQRCHHSNFVRLFSQDWNDMHPCFLFFSEERLITLIPIHGDFMFSIVYLLSYIYPLAFQILLSLIVSVKL